jgi:hypothetical protein
MDLFLRCTGADGYHVKYTATLEFEETPVFQMEYLSIFNKALVIEVLSARGCPTMAKTVVPPQCMTVLTCDPAVATQLEKSFKLERVSPCFQDTRKSYTFVTDKYCAHEKICSYSSNQL